MVLISAQCALNGAITPNIRRISIEWKGFDNFFFLVIYDSQPSEEDVEEMDCVVGQIIADIPFRWSEQVEVIVSTEPLWELKCLDRIVYQRKEYVPPTPE